MTGQSGEQVKLLRRIRRKLITRARTIDNCPDYSAVWSNGYQVAIKYATAIIDKHLTHLPPGSR